MSLGLIMNTAQSGLMTAQTQLRVVSDNVANVNTEGYVRKIADQVSVSSQGSGAGVEIARVRLATDRFLQAASLDASADAGAETARYELYDRIQGLFGDPGGDSGFFSQIGSVFSAFAASAEDAVSSPRRQDALFKVEALFDEASRIHTQIQSVREDADGRIVTAVETANTLLRQIEALNVEISRASVVGHDASGAETAQAALIGQLSEIMDVRITPRAVGGITLRTGDGMMLAGEGHAVLSYERAGAINAESVFNDIFITEPRGEKRSLMPHLDSGELRGLVTLRDVDAPQASERLAELMSQVADELNRAHNAHTSVPPPRNLIGRNVGTDLATALDGFSGLATVAVTNASNAIVARADIDFSGGAISINGVATSPADFLTTLNAQLGGAATATFGNGVLTISANSTGQGVVVAEGDPASDRAGRGFSHTFGLNDLIISDRNTVYQTGLSGTSPHGFTPGETLSFRFTDQDGTRLREVSVAVPAGTSVNDLLAAINDPTTGVGRFGAYTLDDQGALVFTASRSPAPSLSVTEDRTTHTASGQSVSEFFGLSGGIRASRADAFSIRSDISANPGRLALAQLDLTASGPTPALSSGDGRGALALADAGQRASSFSSAGGALGGQLSVTRYASELSGDIGGRASAAKTRAETAQALFTEAKARQTAQEGVNLDEELVKMTTYQQAYNASARLIQAARDMYDVLIGMV